MDELDDLIAFTANRMKQEWGAGKLPWDTQPESHEVTEAKPTPDDIATPDPASIPAAPPSGWADTPILFANRVLNDAAPPNRAGIPQADAGSGGDGPPSGGGDGAGIPQAGGSGGGNLPPPPGAGTASDSPDDLPKAERVQGLYQDRWCVDVLRKLEQIRMTLDVLRSGGAGSSKFVQPNTQSQTGRSDGQEDEEDDRWTAKEAYDFARPFLNRTKVGRMFTRTVDFVRRAAPAAGKPAMDLLSGATNRFYQSKLGKKLTGNPKKAPSPPQGQSMSGATKSESRAAGSVGGTGRSGVAAAENAAVGGETAATGGAGAAGEAAAVGAGTPMAAAGPAALFVAAGVQGWEDGQERGKMAKDAVESLAELPVKVRDFAYELENAAKRFEGVSASVSQTLAELEAERLFRTIESGERQGGSISELTASIDRFEKATQPWEDMLSTVKNAIGSGLLDNLSALVELAAPIRDYLKVLAATAGYKEDTSDDGLFWDDLTRLNKEAERKQDAGRALIDAARRANDNR